MGRRRSQQTFRDKGPVLGGNPTPGTLFVVGNVIGSPDDLSSRAVMILKNASIIVAETPLHAQSLLVHHGIQATITSYSQSKQDEKIHVLLDRLAKGHNIAFLSDSGMPVIYDPGRRLIAAAQRRGFSVKVVPGPTALTAAIAVSGSSGDRFTFEGRLPRTNRRLNEFFKRFGKERRTLVFYAMPSSLQFILKSLTRTLPAIHVTVAVNLTRTEERIYQGRPGELQQRIRSISPKDEVTVVLDGNWRLREQS